MIKALLYLEVVYSGCLSFPLTKTVDDHEETRRRAGN